MHLLPGQLVAFFQGPVTKQLVHLNAVDIVVDYYHGIQVGLAPLAGQLGATYAIPIVYVPVLMITHVVAFYLLVRQPGRQAASGDNGDQ